MKGDLKMKTLRCNAKSCVYNNKEACEKDSIVVGDGNKMNNEIKCESYTPFGSTTKSYEMAEESHIYNQTYEQPNIDCMAEQCVYNEKHNCTASAVKIDANTMEKYAQTTCETYKRR